MLSLCVQLVGPLQVRLLTRILGGDGSSPVTASPEPVGRPPCTTPHSIKAKPARMLSCINRRRAPICEQSIPVDVIWARACGWRTHATTMRMGSATYHKVLVLSFIFIFLLMHWVCRARSLRLHTGARHRRGSRKVTLVQPNTILLFQIIQLRFQFL